ncbi:MAG TPA: TonB-dependent receptor [Puia sp.]|jgi:TonB-linked SusC/RagA family outer membrane protein
MSKLYCFLGILLFHCSVSFAQTRQIFGKVLDAKDKSGLSGVTISAKGSKASVASGPDGSFSIKVGPKATALHFSYIGFDDQEVPISTGGDPIVVSLTGSQKALNEVVVVGYGKAMKKDVTGSIAQVSAKDIENFPAPSFESAIQGKAPGVVVSSGSGKLGQAIQINIRGTSSISASSQPLYVIDGLPVTSTSVSDRSNDDTNPLADINPNDIESVEVLKDASASAIYGARAGNGVVLITTKKGRTGQKTVIELNTSQSESNPTRKWKFLNGKQYVDLVHKSEMNDARYDFENGFNGFGSVDEALDYYTNDPQDGYNALVLDPYSQGTDVNTGGANSDWQAQVYHKNAPSSQINLSATGGNDKTRFFISGFFNTQDAIVINNKFQRAGARFNIDHTASDRLTLGLNLAVDRSQLNRITYDNAFSTPGQLVAQLPINPIIDPATHLPNNNTLYPSGVYDALFDQDRQYTYRALGNAYVNFKILPSLAFQSEFGADILNLNENEFQGKESQDGAGIGKGSFINSQNVTYNTNNYFTFTPTIGDDHKLTAVLGMSYQQNDYQHGSASGEGFPSDAVKNLTGATNITSAVTSNDRYTFLSYFLRANYSWNDRFLVSVSDRIDGASRFDPSRRYGNFPAASVGYILSEEDAFKNIKALSFLKVRASYGLTGNSEIGEQQFRSLYSVTNYPNMPGFAPFQLASPGLHWEKTAQADVGVNFGFFRNRLTGEIDYYHKHTTNLLLSTNIPYTVGYYSITSGNSTIYQNLGIMNNKGVEISLTSQNLTGAFKWTTTFNAAYNKNQVGSLKGQTVENSDGYEGAYEGQAVGTFRLRKMVGVDPANGDALYDDGKGGTTNDYGSAPREYVGHYTPSWTGGLTNTFSYMGFDLSVFFYGVTGVHLYNSAGTYMTAGLYNGFDNQTIDLVNAWGTPGQKTSVPRPGWNFGSGADGPSTRWLYKGDYLRLKNLTFGYSIPASAANAMKIKSLRLYVAGTNLFTSTKYPGDPEVNTNVVSTVYGGQDFYTIPQAKTLTVGLTARF